MTSQLNNQKTKIEYNLYEKDFYLWINETANLLRQGKLQEVDLENLIEEIEAMGRSEKKSVTSNLRILLMHLLKYKYQPEKRTNSWLFTIIEHRKRIKDSFKDSPSLKRLYLEIFAECYQDARELAQAETGLPLYAFPKESPFSPEDTLNLDYLPN